jgi:hypothetical protein
VVPLAIDLHKDFIEVPFVTRSGATPAQVIGKGLAELPKEKV